MVGSHWLDELQLGIAQIKQGKFYRSLVYDFRADNWETVLVSPELEGFVSIRNGDGEVV